MKQCQSQLDVFEVTEKLEALQIALYELTLRDMKVEVSFYKISIFVFY